MKCGKCRREILVPEGDEYRFCPYCNHSLKADEKEMSISEAVKWLRAMARTYDSSPEPYKSKANKACRIAIRSLYFKDYFDELHGSNLEVTNWHMNGDLEPFDSFYDCALEWSGEHE